MLVYQGVPLGSTAASGFASCKLPGTNGGALQKRQAFSNNSVCK